MSEYDSSSDDDLFEFGPVSLSLISHAIPEGNADDQSRSLDVGSLPHHSALSLPSPGLSNHFTHPDKQSSNIHTISTLFSQYDDEDDEDTSAPVISPKSGLDVVQPAFPVAVADSSVSTTVSQPVHSSLADLLCVSGQSHNETGDLIGDTFTPDVAAHVVSKRARGNGSKHGSKHASDDVVQLPLVVISQADLTSLTPVEQIRADVYRKHQGLGTSDSSIQSTVWNSLEGKDTLSGKTTSEQRKRNQVVSMAARAHEVELRRAADLEIARAEKKLNSAPHQR